MILLAHRRAKSAKQIDGDCFQVALVSTALNAVDWNEVACIYRTVSNALGHLINTE